MCPLFRTHWCCLRHVARKLVEICLTLTDTNEQEWRGLGKKIFRLIHLLDWTTLKFWVEVNNNNIVQILSWSKTFVWSTCWRCRCTEHVIHYFMTFMTVSVSMSCGTVTRSLRQVMTKRIRETSVYTRTPCRIVWWSWSHKQFWWERHHIMWIFVCYWSRKWELNRKITCVCRCDERLKAKVEGSTHLTYSSIFKVIRSVVVLTRILSIFALRWSENVMWW